MPEMKNKSPKQKVTKTGKTGRAGGKNFPARLRNELSKGLKIAGIHPTIETQPIRRTNLHRITVLAKEFEKMRPSERQDLVWRIIGQRFSPDEQLQISMILTLAPTELEGNL